MTTSVSATLIVRRLIKASPEKLFAAWTRPEQLMQWWGPQGVQCSAAEIDLRAGGAYRIANRFSDGTLVWIAGRFELVEPPARLVYSWKLETQTGPAERVTVRFEPRNGSTEVIVTHERIADEATRAGHESGWAGCLDKLALFAGEPR
jgi:uncharacterized protein YndB with AHSA1/START domain